MLANEKQMNEFVNQAREKYIDERPYLRKYGLLDDSTTLENFENIPAYEFDSFFFHLIADLLYLHKPIDQYIDFYLPFVHLLERSGCNAEVFSLNHDLLVETILHKHCIPFSNGFTTEGSELYSDEGSVIPIFRGSFEENVRLQKLHGGLDIYRYDYLEKENTLLGYDYFLTDGFYAKQVANHFLKGEKIQNFTPDIRPQFITGRDKLAVIHSDCMYNTLHERFKANLKKLDELYIIGYSYGDEYLNEIIKESVNSIELVVNINPFDKFKFAHKNVHELGKIEELNRFI